MTSLVPAPRPLTVPTRHIEPFERLRALGDDQFSELFKALTEADTTAHRHALTEFVHERALLGLEETNSILDALMGLAAHSQQSRSSALEVAERVAISPQFTQTGSVDEQFSNRLARALSCEVIRLNSKAISLGAAHERIFVSAQILTDLRPLFDDSITDKPEPDAAVICHTLMLHFIGSTGTHDDFFVVLSDDDIETMRDALDRAIQKAESLRTLLHESGISYLSSED